MQLISRLNFLVLLSYVAVSFVLYPFNFLLQSSQETGKRVFLKKKKRSGEKKKKKKTEIFLKKKRISKNIYLELTIGLKILKKKRRI